MSQFNLKTGDILLFDYEGGGLFGLFTSAIKYFTNSEYSHVAMVLKDPEFIHPSLKGYYIWESSWEGKPDPQDNKIKLGVQITPFEEIYNHYKLKNSKIVVRRINNNEYFTNDKLNAIHKVVYDKPYDLVPKDWIDEIFHKDAHPQKTDRFWCSALIGYIYTKCNILDSKTDWSGLRASDFSEKYKNNLQFINDTNLLNEERIL